MSIRACSFCGARFVLHELGTCECLICTKPNDCPPNNPHHPQARRPHTEITAEDADADRKQQRRIAGYRRAQQRKVGV